MTKWWTGLVWATAMFASAAPAYAQYIVNQPATPPIVEPLPFGPSTADGPPTPPFPPQGMQGNGSNSLPDDLPNATSPPPMVPDGNFFFVSVEYLHWWAKADNRSNVIVTSSSDANLVGNFGALFQPNTTIIGPSQGRGLNGVRATLGMAPEWFVPVEISGFYVAGSSRFDRVSDGAIGSQMLAFAIFSVDPAINTEAVQLIAFPDLIRGQIGISQSTSVFGGEVNARVWNLIRQPDFQALGLEATVGARYAGLNDELEISSVTINTIAAPILGFNNQGFGQNFAVGITDLFRTRNQFYGPQIGLRATYPVGPINFELRNNLAVGMNTQTVSIMGASALYGPNPPPSVPPNPPIAVAGAGLYAVPSNSGHFTRRRISTVDEFTLSLGLPITEKMQLSVGYNLFIFTNVVRPGDQISRFIDTRQVPTSTNFAPNGTTIPPFPFATTNFWSNGITFTMAFTW